MKTCNKYTRERKNTHCYIWKIRIIAYFIWESSCLYEKLLTATERYSWYYKIITVKILFIWIEYSGCDNNFIKSLEILKKA